MAGDEVVGSNQALASSCISASLSPLYGMRGSRPGSRLCSLDDDLGLDEGYDLIDVGGSGEISVDVEVRPLVTRSWLFRNALNLSSGVEHMFIVDRCRRGRSQVTTVK